MSSVRLLTIAGLLLLLISILTVFLGPIGSRIGWWDYYFAVTLFKIAAALAAVALLLIISSLIRNHGQSRKRKAIISLLVLSITLPLATTLLYWKNAKQTYPPIQDISTDLFEPPQFWYAPNVKVYNPLAIADMQMEAYPDVEPVILNIPFDQAYAKVYEVIKNTGWEIHTAEPKSGRIEATDTTFWFGFSDDIVIRVTTEGESSIIDIRSASRFGSGGDGGTNAKRVMRIIDALNKRVSR